MHLRALAGREMGWLTVAGAVVESADGFSIESGPESDWFNDPTGTTRLSSAPVLATAVDGDMQLVARVQVGFGAMFDAGVLFVHQSTDDYAKLCFEQTPAGEPSVVSVVTRGHSDDANGPIIDGDEVWLRASMVGPVVAFHWSNNGQHWNLHRYFRLRDPHAPTTIGFCSQSPTGTGCTSHFHDVAWTETTLAALRDGS